MHVIGTAGHVDHGKSTLVQRLTGIDPDRFEEEKRRGLTIDLGFAWLTLPSGNEIGIIDVPGHERFIKNMLAGAGGISVCLFVVAANEGWMPQSSEHLAILDILGVEHGVVALTKSDSVDGETLEFAQAEIEERLAGTSLAALPVVPCSAVTGFGLDDLVAALDAAVGGAPRLVDSRRPRLWVDRVFTIAGAGTVVTGTLAGGSLGSAQEVDVAPGGGRGRIRKIQSHKKELPVVGPGNRVALNLAGVERDGLARGDAILAPPWRNTRLVDAWVRVLATDLLGDDVSLKEKGAHLLYVGSAETPVRIRLLEGKELPAGEAAPVQLQLRDPLPLRRGDRFVLRDAGRILTLGGGVVLDPLAHPARRGDRDRVNLLTKLHDADDVDALKLLLEAEGDIDLADAELRMNVRAENVSGAESAPPSIAEGRGTEVDSGAENAFSSIAENRSSAENASELDGIERIGARLFSTARLEELMRRAEEIVAEHHAARPLEKGIDRESLRRSLELSPDVFDGFLARSARLIADDARVRLAQHSVTLKPEEQKERDRLLARLEEEAFSPPLAKALGAPSALLRALTETGDLVKVGDFYLTGRRAEEAKATIKKLIETEGPVTVAQIRDALGTTRKYAVPLSEWLDSTGTTKRQGDLRALGPRA